jgi:hypothetical protein
MSQFLILFLQSPDFRVLGVTLTVVCNIIYIYFVPIPVAARSKAWVFGRSLTGIAGSNPTGGMDVCVVLDVWTLA